MQYKIVGEPMPAVICELESGESMITERGSMSWMSPNMEMKTTANGAGMIAFASSFPGAIRVVEVTPDRPVITQKGSFLAAESGVELSVFFQKRFGAGLFGGEGFIMQKLTGSGLAFLEIDGSAVEYELQPGQSMIVDSGNLAMMDASCSMDVVAVKGVKNALFGGEGLFNTIVTGPGKIVVQTMPASGVAAAIIPYLPVDRK